MPPLVCPTCNAESSQGAYVCHLCGNSFVHERSKPYFRALQLTCLATCLVSLGIWVYALGFAGGVEVTRWLGIAGIHLFIAYFFINRLRGRRAYFERDLQVKPNTYGWVAKDFAVMFIVFMLLFFGISTIR